MSSWLNHPRYVPLRDALVARLRSHSYHFRRLNNVIFLCGKNQSAARDRLKLYLARYHSKLLVFYAENVWAHIAGRSDLDALQMEKYLADLADVVIVIVESPGTFTELGAFSISEPLRKKLLPILDARFRGAGSFIETGPVKWIDATSAFRPTIWAPLDRLLEVVDEITDRLKRIPDSHPTRVTDLSGSPKHSLFFLCDLLSVIQPATDDIIAFYMQAIVGGSIASELRSLLGLACAMDLVQTSTTIIGGVQGLVFYRSTPEDHLGHPYHHRALLDLPSERARHVSVLQVIPDSLAALTLVAPLA